MNFEYMSVTKDKNILNLQNNNNDDDDPLNKIILEIEFEKPSFKNWYLSFKSIDTELMSQYPIEKEVIIQPYSIFEIREVKTILNNNLYIKLYMRSNLLSKISNYDKIPKQIQQNLGIINNTGQNILESYPDYDLEKIISIKFKNKDELLKNKENIAKMKNIRVLDMSNLNLIDNDIKILI